MTVISIESSNNLKKNILSQNTCHICVLYHFDLGLEKYLIDGISEEDFKDIKNKIEEEIGNELMKKKFYKIKNYLKLM